MTLMNKIGIVAIALMIALMTVVIAQTPVPRTKNLVDSRGIFTGTATEWDNRVTYRDSKGELLGVSYLEVGKITFFDPHGKVIFVATQEGRTITYRDASGKVIETITLERDGTLRDSVGNVVTMDKK